MSRLRNVKRATGRFTTVDQFGAVRSKGFSPVAREESASNLSPAELGVLVRVRDYCDQNNTDGLIPKTFLLAVGRGDGRAVRGAIAGLIEKGYIVEEASGYRDVNFNTWANSSQERADKRRRERDRKARQRHNEALDVPSYDEVGHSEIHDRADDVPSYDDVPLGQKQEVGGESSSKPGDVPLGQKPVSHTPPPLPLPPPPPPPHRSVKESSVVNAIQEERLKKRRLFLQFTETRRSKQEISEFTGLTGVVLDRKLEAHVTAGDLKYIPDDCYQTTEKSGDTLADLVASVNPFIQGVQA